MAKKQEPRSAVAQVRLVRTSERLTPKERTRRRVGNSAAAAGTSAFLTGVPAAALGVKGAALPALVGTAAAGGAALGTLKPVPRTRRTYAFEASKRDAFGIEKVASRALRGELKAGEAWDKLYPHGRRGLISADGLRDRARSLSTQAAKNKRDVRRNGLNLAETKALQARSAGARARYDRGTDLYIEKYHPAPVQQAMGRGQKAKEAVDTTKSTVRRVRRMAAGFSNPRVQGLPQGEVTNRYSRAFL